MRSGIPSLVVSLVLGSACPAVSSDWIFRSETCRGEMEINLGNGDLDYVDPHPWRGARPGSDISPARALDLAAASLRRSAILNPRLRLKAWEILFLGASPPLPGLGDRFYLIKVVGDPCEKGNDRRNYAFVAVAMAGGAVTLPKPVGTYRRSRTPRSALWRLLINDGDFLTPLRRLATRLDREYHNFGCSLAGCPWYDLNLSSVSYVDGPPDVRLIARFLPPRLLWFTSQEEWPQLSPRQAARRAAEALEHFQHCEPGTLRGILGANLRLVRPGRWLYVVTYISRGKRCDPDNPPLWDHLRGELVVLMNGDVLLPNDAIITWMRVNPDGPHPSNVFYIHQLPSRRRYIPPSWH